MLILTNLRLNFQAQKFGFILEQCWALAFISFLYSSPNLAYWLIRFIKQKMLPEGASMAMWPRRDYSLPLVIRKERVLQDKCCRQPSCLTFFVFSAIESKAFSYFQNKKCRQRRQYLSCDPEGNEFEPINTRFAEIQWVKEISLNFTLQRSPLW